ncbi:MAG: SDR family oxidoreductase [Betaproteobacteria bacterium]|jgi:NAD(P)-dependent dehydrogenase (short-subunit alcohol dehydrogenase family)|nr:SDR family oxidoreductase [Pseudomonadota bacterium]NBO95813.1 SDR family oxidoreductase [Betaproteobacteria bacterium]NBP36476.1 SDR family oxidoreductase [Betaproteobacteria bacterium]NBP39788.1 SDR family oxidoreductase [Betaproteobacteria bacterium]NBQ79756.1 SDR family oxidoreductase [Betaproteobacteria bacterium]
MRLNNRHIIVTGGAQGIGLACALRFAREGAKVLVVDKQEAPVLDGESGFGEAGVANAEQVASSLDRVASTDEHVASKIAWLQADVAERSSAKAALAMGIKLWGRVDGLLNNAGIIHGCNFLDLKDEDFDRVLAVNLRGYFIFSQVIAAHMVAEKIQGAIVNMSSVNALLAIPDQLPYAVSKGGVNQLTRVSAMSLAEHGIRVNAVGPGTIATELARHAVMKSEAAKQKILSRTPLLRLGEPDEVAQVASFLMSDEASYLTGQVIYPDGGRMALNYTVSLPS